MAENHADDPVIKNPTYMADIRNFFRPIDIAHMRGKNIDVGTYAGVKRNAARIYFATSGPDAVMPPPESGGQWSANRSRTFQNWITNGSPLGSATPKLPGPAPGQRVRKNVASLTAAEVKALKKAFAGVMARDKDRDDPNSYFTIAGYHGLPGDYCQHHVDGYNPWHRVFLKRFEDQLRTIPGCEDVTLPYWDITTLLPEVLQQEPLAAYTLPYQVPGLPFPYTTSRYDPGIIKRKMESTPSGLSVYQDIDTSKAQSTWGEYNTCGYQDYAIQAHDGGHVSIGDTMRDQHVAAYDPVFWFFHCNLDRLWLSWQTQLGATELAGFESTITDPDPQRHLFLLPGFNTLPPFDEPPFGPFTTNDSIAFGIAYDKLDVLAKEDGLTNAVGSIDATYSFSITGAAPVSVRVKGINRLNIPGSFIVKLMADGEPISNRAFFQPSQPRRCAGCAKNGIVNIDFLMDQADLVDKQLSVEIDVPSQEELGTKFPLSEAGNPTINARLLLNDG